MGFSHQENWNGLPCLLQGDLPDLRIQSVSLMSPARGFFITSSFWEALGLFNLVNEHQLQLKVTNCIQSVQFSSVAQSFLTLCDPMNRSTPGLPIHHQLLEFTQTHVHQVSAAIQPSYPLSSLLLLPSIPPSIRVFSNESTLCMREPKYWSFSFSISPSKEIPGLISFRMEWLDLLAVQGTLKRLPTPQFKSINSSALSLLYSPTLASIHDHRKNDSLD